MGNFPSAPSGACIFYLLAAIILIFSQVRWNRPPSRPPYTRVSRGLLGVSLPEKKSGSYVLDRLENHPISTLLSPGLEPRNSRPGRGRART